MRRVHSADTTPEMVVRKLTHSLGFRYRLHRKDLPGNPDIVFPAKKKIIFVHGCFWHGHECKRGQRVPKENHDYWVRKLQSNTERDKKHLYDLSAAGWKVLVIWECETKNLVVLRERIIEFIG
jgi:DNA mismatch endonuclease (patch repair protein)